MDNNLQTYVNNQVATMSPLKATSLELLTEAEKINVIDEPTLKVAMDERRKITKHRTTVKNLRLEITRKFDAVKSQFMDAEKDVLAPAEQALGNISQKIMDYQKEQELLAEIERQRVEKITSQFATNTRTLRTQKACDERGAEIKAIFAKLPADDQQNAIIKLKFTEVINALLNRKDELSQAEKDAAEQAEIQKRREAERKEAELAAKRAAAQAAPTVKTGIKTVRTFTIINPALVPREYCEPSEKLIREALKNGVAEIAGVEIKQEQRF